MKPVSLRFSCFGPYMDEQTVNFRELGSRGIFLICGETGSGKTTILDAICYALFGRSSGGLRQGIEVMRCKAAKPSDRTIVEYIFESGGNTYKFHRELRYGRKNLIEEDGCEILRGEVYEPIFQNPTATNVNKKAEEILGLSYDQFCQVVMLPQGKFERLLVSNSEEKEKILTSLFHADKWNDIVLGVKARADEEAKRLEKELADIQSRLSVYECDSVSALKEKIGAAEEEAASLETAVQQAELLKRQTAKAYEDSIKDNEIFTALEACRIRLDSLMEKAEWFDSRRKALKLAEAADAIRENHTAFVSANEAAAEAGKDLQSAAAALAAAEKAESEAAKEKALHEEGRAAYDKNREVLTRLRDSRELYAGIGEKKKAAEDAAADERKKQAAAESAKQAYEAARGKWEEAGKANDEAVIAYQEISRNYTANIAGNLASRLEEGAPCPVCGSTHHPSPAKLAEGESVSEDDVEAANRAIKSASEAFSRAKAAMDGAKEKSEGAAEAFNSARSTAAAAKAAYEVSLKNTLEGINDSETLENWIRKIEGRIKAFEQAEQMFIAMKERRPQIPLRLVMFPKENHALTRTGNMKNQARHLREIVDWMKVYLQGKEEAHE